MIRIKIPQTATVNNNSVRTALGKLPDFIGITDTHIELPDNLTQTDIDNINTALYSEQANWQTLLAALPIAQQAVWTKLLKKIGELP